MWAYVARRLLLVVPTLFGIMVINFVIVQAAPGGPVDQTLAQIRGAAGGTLERVTGSASGDAGTTRAARGIEPELIDQLKRLYGFDQPAHVRFFDMMRRFATFDFGESFFKGRPVLNLIVEKLPVSISLGLWATLITYLVSIPLGIRKAVRDGSRFDVWTSTVISVGNAIPSFLFAVLLIVLFAGGSYVQWFPLRGLVSNDWAQLPWWQKILDYFWHLALPLASLVVGSFASLTLLTKNSFLEEINKQYVLTARAKGLDERGVLYGHVFRNAMLIVIAGFPAAFIGVLFTGSLLTEIIFSLDGLGLLGYEAAVQRDYPIVFGTLFIYTLVGLILKIVSDLTYTVVDPRIDFERR
ncbi:MAG TPA: microcin C ABC transporter permease YejB [Geminicoccaceae bacterium]|nr:microcin C ABC transporter permease YejB [Geminicoccaceae bacterium]